MDPKTLLKLYYFIRSNKTQFHLEVSTVLGKPYYTIQQFVDKNEKIVNNGGLIISG